MIDGFYDPIKDKIYGKPNTLVYYHEEGHRDWYKKGIEQSIQCYSWIIILCTISYVGFLSGNKLISFMLSLPIIALVISEIHAWIFAFKKWWRII